MVLQEMILSVECITSQQWEEAFPVLDRRNVRRKVLAGENAAEYCQKVVNRRLNVTG